MMYANTRCRDREQLPIAGIIDTSNPGDNPVIANGVNQVKVNNRNQLSANSRNFVNPVGNNNGENKSY